MALKTNSKKARENLKNYIISNSDFEGYKEFEHIEEMKENKNISKDEIFEEVAAAIVKTVYNEKIKHDKRRLTHYEYFEDWCQGLPGVLDTCYYYNRSAIDDLGDILEQTEEERNKYTEQEAEDMLTKLLFRTLN